MAAIEWELEQLNRDISETKAKIKKQRQELWEDDYADIRERRIEEGELRVLVGDLQRFKERKDVLLRRGIDSYTSRTPHVTSEFGVGVGGDVMGIMESLHARVRTLEARVKNFA
jgi:hypothetical protein